MKSYKEFFFESTRIPFVLCGIGKLNSLQEWAWENSYDTLDAVSGRHSERIMHNHDKIHDIYRSTDILPLHNSLSEHYSPHINSLSSPHLDAIVKYIDGSHGLNSLLVRYHQQDLDFDKPEDFEKASEYHRDHYPVNISQLRGEKVRNHDEFIDRLGYLDDALRLSPDSPHEYHVYTGVGRRFNVGKFRSAGHSIIHLPAYTSTSIDPKIASIFSRQKVGASGHTDESEELMPEMIRLSIPKGSRYGMYLPQNSVEKEFLLRRGTNIRFLGKPRYTVVSDVGDPKHIKIHDAEIV